MWSVLETPQGLVVGPAGSGGLGLWQWRAGRREKVRPAHPLQHPTREKVRPASVKRPILGCFERAGRTFSRSHPPPAPAGRTFSRTGRTEVMTVKPTTPLQPLRWASMKPPSPLLAPEQQPLKPVAPLQPKNTPKTPISHPQRRRRFQSHTGTSEHRRRWFQATRPPGRQGQDAVPVGSNDTTASQISHVIYRGHFSRCPKNVAIPTT